MMAMSAMSARIVLALLMAASGCTFQAWPPGTEIKIEIDHATQTPQTQWQYTIDLAVREWSDALGDDCPFPYTFTASGDHQIALVGIGEWSHGDLVGATHGDRIEIREGLYDVRMVGVTAHELGHAFGLEHASKGSGDLMAPTTESNIPTVNDTQRAREALGCSQL